MKNLKIFILIFLTTLTANLKPEKSFNSNDFLKIFTENQNMECVMPGGEYPVPILSNIVTFNTPEIVLCTIIKQLFKRPANININIQQTHPEGIPVHVDVDGVKAVIRSKFPEGTTFEGWTPLMWATILRRTMIVKKLIELGADTSIQSSNGLTAKNIAEYMEYEELVDLLD